MIFRATSIPQLTDDTVLSMKTVEPIEINSHFELPTDPEIWRGVNELRVEIDLPPDADGTIGCELVLDSQNEGFDYPDAYWFSALVSPRAGNIWEGWRELRMPAECFYTRGIPASWGSFRSAHISLPEGAALRNIRLVSRESVDGPRMTDEALVNAIDPNYAGLETLRDTHSTEQAIETITEYFRSSRNDRGVIHLRGLGPFIKDELDAVLAGRIMEHDWSKGIDWSANPNGYIEWSIRVHGLAYLRPLIEAWRTAPDDRDATLYAAKIEEIVIDWIAKSPVPYGVRACGLPWGHSLVVAARAYEVLAEAFEVMCSCENTVGRSIIDTLKSIWEHATYLLAFESFPPSNKTICEGRTIGGLGCAFPEFREAGDWRETGYRRLLDDMGIQVFSDGASYELSPGYQLAIASWFLEAHATAGKFSFPLDPKYEEGVRSMYRWSTSISRPDFSRPSVSDAGSLDSQYGAELENAGRLLQDDQAIWAATAGKSGTPPAYKSVANRDSGYFVMRSGWDSDARYLLFEGGSFGRFHQHEDMLGIDVYAYGTPFIVDPGITSYFPNPWTDYYRTTQAHNTILIDGCGQARRTGDSIEEWIESARDKTHWISEERYDVASATYNGPYMGVEGDFAHYRAVVFVKPDYFLVFDEIRGEGNHTCEALFHFMPFRVLVDTEKHGVRTGRITDSNLELQSLTGITPELVCGQNDPVQGWVSIGRQDVPAPVAVFRTDGSLPWRTGFLIAPYPSDRVTAGISTGIIENGDEWQVEIASPGRTDTVTINWRTEDLVLK